jgi:nucleoside-diphosphate kinase
MRALLFLRGNLGSNTASDRKGISMTELTFSIIKPDAVRNRFAGAILAEIEKYGFRVVGIRKQVISREQAEDFYAVHAEKTYFEDLTAFMASGPVFLIVLAKDNAIEDLRKLMGATNSRDAAEGTIRKKYGNPDVIRENAIHGSDTEENAANEIRFWFAGYELTY